jgi:glyoxylase-like metal-dependent hydrolase (beta-lactamase superfamily II)
LRALALDEDLIVFVSRIWQTSCTALRAGGEGFVIDSVVYPDELAALPGVLEQAGFPVSGLLATHGDWDHLLARLAFPGASLGVCEATAARLAAAPGRAQRDLRRFDEEHYVQRPAPLSLAGAQALPVPGRLELGARKAGGAAELDPGARDPGAPGGAAELELHPASGHTADGTALWVGWRAALVCGDYLSPVEIPMISVEDGGSAEAYLATLERLAPLVARARHVIPGHGTPLRRERAEQILDEDLSYLRALLEAGDAPLPRGRRTQRQRQIHAANRAALG